jgi:hypothetical protein
MRKTQAGASEASPAWAAREANPLPSQTRQRSRHRHNSLCDCRPEVCGPRGLVFFSRAAAQCNHIMPLFSPPHAHPQPDERGKCRRSKHRDGIAAGNPAQDRNAVGTNGDDCPARAQAIEASAWMPGFRFDALRLKAGGIAAFRPGSRSLQLGARTSLRDRYAYCPAIQGPSGPTPSGGRAYAGWPTGSGPLRDTKKSIAKNLSEESRP